MTEKELMELCKSNKDCNLNIQINKEWFSRVKKTECRGIGCIGGTKDCHHEEFGYEGPTF